MPVGGEVADDVQHLGDELGVERRGDLVEQQDARSHRQRPDDRDPLLLTARQPVRVLLGLLGEADAVEQGNASLLGQRPC